MEFVPKDLFGDDNWKSCKDYNKEQKKRCIMEKGINYLGTCGENVNEATTRLQKKRINRIGRNGRRLLCLSCGSYRHFLADCPHSWENMAKASEVFNVMPAGFNKNQVRQLDWETRNCAVLDNTCDSTVCGDKWIAHYIESLHYRDRLKVQIVASQRIFNFGGEVRLRSKGEYSLPAIVAGKAVTIKTDVVDADIPLLLSRTSMKRADMKINILTDTGCIFGKEVTLGIATTGHYYIPLDNFEHSFVDSRYRYEGGQIRVQSTKEQVEEQILKSECNKSELVYLVNSRITTDLDMCENSEKRHTASVDQDCVKSEHKLCGHTGYYGDKKPKLSELSVKQHGFNGDFNGDVNVTRVNRVDTKCRSDYNSYSSRNYASNSQKPGSACEIQKKVVVDCRNLKRGNMYARFNKNSDMRITEKRRNSGCDIGRCFRYSSLNRPPDQCPLSTVGRHT